MKKIIILVLLVVLSTQAQSFSSGNLYLEVTNAGATVFGSPDQQNLQVTRISILVSGAQNQVFDYLNDADSAGTAAETASSPDFGSFQVKSVYDNSYSYKPPAYKVELNAYGWNNAAYAVSHYNITNIDSNEYDAKVGFEVLPFIDDTYGNEFVEYYSSGDYIRIHKDTASTYTGIKIINFPLTSLYVEDWVSGYNKSDTALYNNLFYGSIIDTFTASDSGSVLFPSINPQVLAPGESTDIYIALATGVDAAQLDSNMTVAIQKYNDFVVDVKNDDVMPFAVTLEQNYPNPFNPTTTIQYSINKKNTVSMYVCDILGRKVQTLVNEVKSPGTHEVNFNSSNLASGVYFYTLQAGKFISTKKMIVLK